MHRFVAASASSSAAVLVSSPQQSPASQSPSLRLAAVSLSTALSHNSGSSSHTAISSTQARCECSKPPVCGQHPGISGIIHPVVQLSGVLQRRHHRLQGLPAGILLCTGTWAGLRNKDAGLILLCAWKAGGVKGEADAHVSMELIHSFEPQQHSPAGIHSSWRVDPGDNTAMNSSSIQ